MMAQIAAAMALSAGFREAALGAIGPYESRGKGKGRRQASRRSTAQVKRASVKAGNRIKNRRAHRG